MNRILRSLIFWVQAVPCSAFENMAIDEALLKKVVRQPILRTYPWARPTVSIGVFEPLPEEQDIVRRWTGGGIVHHDPLENLSYTLIVPRPGELAQVSAKESYRIIHEAVVKALAGCSIRGHLSAEEGISSGGPCIRRVVLHDVVDESGQKIAGAGQRRTNLGLLHQGFVQIPESKRGVFSHALAHALSSRIKPVRNAVGRLKEEISRLVEEKYASEAWIQRHRIDRKGRGRVES